MGIEHILVAAATTVVDTAAGVIMERFVAVVRNFVLLVEVDIMADIVEVGRLG